MLNNPQSRSWKALSVILLLAAVVGFVMLTLLIFYIPYGVPHLLHEVPHLLRRAAIVPPALCGAAGFLMLRETRRTRQDN